jgi:hypothetical protein
LQTFQSVRQVVQNEADNFLNENIKIKIQDVANKFDEFAKDILPSLRRAQLQGEDIDQAYKAISDQKFFEKIENEVDSLRLLINYLQVQARR